MWQVTCVQLPPGFFDLCTLQVTRTHSMFKYHGSLWNSVDYGNKWLALDNRGQVDTCILDFEKAFDIPPHERLKSKLFSYGIGGKTLKWIDSFLCFRQQRVAVNGVKSDCLRFCRESPKAPFLFPYINYISSDIESEIRLFADDCFSQCANHFDHLGFLRKIATNHTVNLARSHTDTWLRKTEK